MAFDFYLGVSTDTRPIQEETVKQPSGAVINLTGYTVTEKLVHQATGAILSKTGVVPTGTDGKVQFTFAVADFEDTDGNPLAGGWDYQLKCVASGVEVHVPNDGYKTLWATLNVESASASRAYPPTAADLWRFLEGAKLTVADELKPFLAGAARGAYADFERATGRRFLATAGVRVFDPAPNGYIDFREDLSALGDTGGLAILGTSQVLNSDYWLIGGNAAGRGEPYTGLRLKNVRPVPLTWPNYNSIAVTGLWGYGTTIPDDVFQAALARAAWVIAPQLILSLKKGGLKSWTEAGVSESYMDNPLEGLMTVWGGEAKDNGMGGLFGSTVKRYQRWRVS